MLQRFLNWWQTFVAKHVCDYNPNDTEAILAKEIQKKADEINKDIIRLWSLISQAESHIDFVLCDIEISWFREYYTGMDDFEYIMSGIEEHLSERQDSVQALWSIE